MNQKQKLDDIVIIKKYANRRLYNTETSTYITLEELGKLVRENRDFEVVDAKSGTDLTRAVLTQILFEEESKGASMLPTRFLRQIIGFYDNSMQTVLPHYLETMMDVFIQNQTRIKERTDKMLGSFSPFTSMKDIQRQQMEQMQNIMSMFNPFLRDEKEIQIEDLTHQVTELNEEIKRLKKPKK